MAYLKRLSLPDGEDIYAMLQEIASDDNGFHNAVCGMTYAAYRDWLRKEYAYDSGELEEWMVPQSSYWMYDGDTPVGYGRLRHRLNDHLARTSGHIGYAIAKSPRGKGYGNEILSLLIAEGAKTGISLLQIGANANNIPSNRVIRRNGGILLRTDGGKNFYQITING